MAARSKSTTTTPLAHEALLSFKALDAGVFGTPQNHYDIAFGDATRNLLVLGGTGTGKTTAVLAPALDRLLEKGCPGLVLDVKGDYTAQLCAHPDVVHLLGPVADAQQINLIADFAPDVLEGVLKGMCHLKDGEYWGSSAVADCLLVQQAIHDFEQRAATLADLYDALVDPVTFCDALRYHLNVQPENSGHALQQLLRERSRDAFGLLTVGGFTPGTARDDRIAEQYSWHVNQLLPRLSPFAKDPALRERLCASAGVPWQELLYTQGKVILLDMPTNRYAEAAMVTARLLRIGCMRAILSADAEARAAKGYGQDRFTFLLVDEYQQYISAREGSAQTGILDDNTWFDRSRSFGHINIVATQSLSSLRAQVPDPVVRSVLQNFRSLIALGTTDDETLRYLAGIAQHSGVEPVDITKPLVLPSQPGVGFCYTASSCANQGSAQAGLIQTGHSHLPHMNRHIGLERALPDPARYRWAPETTATPPAKPHAAIDTFDPQGRLFFLLPPQSPAYQDFLQAWRHALPVVEGWVKKPVFGRTFRLPANAGPERWEHFLREEVHPALRPGDCLALLRAGEDAPEIAPQIFHDEVVCEEMEKLRKAGIFVLAGLGHADTQYPLGSRVSHNAGTPAGAGQDYASYAYYAQQGRLRPAS